jgi:hypothetical protein
MPDKWIATGTIRYGTTGSDGAPEVKEFRPGDEVKGLSTGEMKELEAAGSIVKQSELQRRAAPGTPSVDEEQYTQQLAAKDAEIANLQAKVAELESKAGDSGSGSGGSGGASSRRASSS